MSKYSYDINKTAIKFNGDLFRYIVCFKNLPVFACSCNDEEINTVVKDIKHDLKGLKRETFVFHERRFSLVDRYNRIPIFERSLLAPHIYAAARMCIYTDEIITAIHSNIIADATISFEVIQPNSTFPENKKQIVHVIGEAFANLKATNANKEEIDKAYKAYAIKEEEYILLTKWFK